MNRLAAALFTLVLELAQACAPVPTLAIPTAGPTFTVPVPPAAPLSAPIVQTCVGCIVTVNQTVIAAPTQAPVPTSATPTAWNCNDPFGSRPDVQFHGSTGVVCVNPNATSFKVLVVKGRLTGAGVKPNGHYENSLLIFTLVSTPACLQGTGCTYRVSTRDGATFGALANGQGMGLYPESPEYGVQGAQVWLHFRFASPEDEHEIQFVP